MNTMARSLPKRAHLVCRIADLLPACGAAARLGGRQVALFHLPEHSPAVRAIGNYDPIGRANILSRGIVGDIDGEPVVASPLYKQHFSLLDGRCIEVPSVRVPVYGTLICDGFLYLVP